MAPAVPWNALFGAALSVRTRAYAPYSRFKVGAAVLTEDGRIFAGCNVENASYGLSLCAERSAVAQAVAAGARGIRAVAIVAATKTPCPPCGMCRQVLVELAAPGTPVRSRTLSGRESRRTVGGLLPDAFTERLL